MSDERVIAGTSTARFWPNYEVIELRTIQEVKHIFGPDGVNVNAHNWCFVGLAGLHGTYMTLNELEQVFDGEHERYTPTVDEKAYVSILILHPRLTVLKQPAPKKVLETQEAGYGEIPITREDIPYLRMLVSKTMKEVWKSQEGSVDAREFVNVAV